MNLLQIIQKNRHHIAAALRVAAGLLEKSGGNPVIDIATLILTPPNPTLSPKRKPKTVKRAKKITPQ